ncbi:MAG: hypothetical protein ACMUIP_18200 [bacterium]
MMIKIYDGFKGNGGIIDKDKYSETDIFCLINDLIRQLTEEEQVALFIHYVSTKTEFETDNCPFNLHTREKALKTLCIGMQKKGLRVVASKCHPYKGSMKHARFNDLIDDYLADELKDEEKDSFEEHMLVCDFCGELFILNCQIIEALPGFKRELSASLQASQKYNIATIEKREQTSQIVQEASYKESHIKGPFFKFLYKIFQNSPYAFIPSIIADRIILCSSRVSNIFSFLARFLGICH